MPKTIATYFITFTNTRNVERVFTAHQTEKVKAGKDFYMRLRFSCMDGKALPQAREWYLNMKTGELFFAHNRPDLQNGIKRFVGQASLVEKLNGQIRLSFKKNAA